MQEMLGTSFVMQSQSSCSVYHVAQLSPKIFVPLGGGILLDKLRIYGISIGIPFLGYYVVYGICCVCYLTGAALVWLIKLQKDPQKLLVN